MSELPEMPDRLWKEYSAVFEDFDDLTLARWLAQTLAQLKGRALRFSHPLVGAGPRATQSLLLAARAAAALAGRDFVTPDDIKAMAGPVLEHRLILRPEFEIEGVGVPEVIQKILQQVAVPR